MDIIRTKTGAQGSLKISVRKPRFEQQVSIVDLIAFTSEFIQGRSVSHPDGRPLYEYRCSDDEFERLTRIINDEETYRLTEPSGAAGFCLFVSEWWRRHYEGGPWAWEPILKAADHPSLLPPARYEVVERGLEFWRRPLLRTGAQRAFLATLACEGGLPLKMLRQEGAGLQRYFRAVLRTFHEYGRSGMSPSRLAEMESRYLPRSFRQDVVFTLAGEIGEAIWELQGRVGDMKDPVAYLDRTEPEWRKPIPLLIEDETARALLNNLVQEANRLSRVKGFDFKVVRRLVDDGSGWNLEAELRIPPTLDALQMKGIFGADVLELPGRFEILSGGDDDNKMLALVTQTGSGDERKYFIEMPPGIDRTRKGATAASGWGLIASSARNLNRSDRIPGAGALSELPWLFVDKEGLCQELEFLGEGSLRTRHESAYLAVSTATRITPQGGGAAEEIGTCPAFERILYRVNGVIECIDQEYGRCVVRTADHQETSAEFKLSGEQIYFSGSSSVVFRGLPNLWEYPPEAVPRRVSNTTIEWRPARSGAWRPYSKDCLGDVFVRALDDGAIRARMNATVVPEGFSLDLYPIDDCGGKIEIGGLSDGMVGFDRSEGIKGETESLDDGARQRLIVHADEEAPLVLGLRFRWDEERETSIRVPFPARGARFVDRDGRFLRNGERIASGRLGGVTAVVTVAGGSGIYSVDGELRAEDLMPEIKKILWLNERLRKTDIGRWEVDLRAIRSRVDSLFRATSNQYAHLRLTIKPPFDQGHLHLDIAPFDLAFKRVKAQGLVRLKPEYEAAKTIDLDRFRVEAVPLWDHHAERESLERCGCGSLEDPYAWRFDPDGRAPGPWIILGLEGEWCRAQPKLWTIEGETQEDPDIDPAAYRLEQVVRIPNQDERNAAFDALLEELSEHPGDPRWTDLLAYLKAFGDLPPATLDLVDRLILKPKAVITLLLNADDTGFDLIFHLLDQTPFSWHLVPIASWTQASERFADMLRGQLEEVPEADEIVYGAFKRFFQKAPAHGPFFEMIVEWLESTIFEERKPTCRNLRMARTPLGAKQVLSLMKNEYRQLLQTHADELQWPTGQAITERFNRTNRLPAGLEKLLIREGSGTRHRIGVVNAPILAAIASVCGLEVSERESQEIRFLRDFDENWFERAYAMALLIGIGEAFEAEPELLGTR